MHSPGFGNGTGEVAHAIEAAGDMMARDVDFPEVAGSLQQPNCIAALLASGKAPSLLEGMRLSAESIDTGAAQAKLEQLIAFTQSGHLASSKFDDHKPPPQDYA